MNQVTKIDLNAPIIPEVGIGEIKLLENAFSLRSLIISNTISGETIDWCFTTEQQIPDIVTLNYKEILLVDVNIFIGKIVSLTVKNGYTGKIFESIGIGSKVSDLLQIDDGFYYDEIDEYIFHKVNRNIQFATGWMNKLTITQEEILNSRITEISILTDAQTAITSYLEEFPKEWLK